MIFRGRACFFFLVSKFFGSTCAACTYQFDRIYLSTTNCPAFLVHCISWSYPSDECAGQIEDHVKVASTVSMNVCWMYMKGARNIGSEHCESGVKRIPGKWIKTNCAAEIRSSSNLLANVLVLLSVKDYLFFLRLSIFDEIDLTGNRRWKIVRGDDTPPVPSPSTSRWSRRLKTREARARVRARTYAKCDRGGKRVQVFGEKGRFGESLAESSGNIRWK